MGIQGAGINKDNKVVIEKSTMERMALPYIGSILRNIAGVNGIHKGGASIDPVIRDNRFNQRNVSFAFVNPSRTEYVLA